MVAFGMPDVYRRICDLLWVNKHHRVDPRSIALTPPHFLTTRLEVFLQNLGLGPCPIPR